VTTLTPPRSFHERTADQRLAALQTANEVRSRRSALKRDLKAGRQSAAVLLADPPDWLVSMKVVDLLIAVPRWGRGKASKALKLAGVSPQKTLAGLSDRQRDALIAALGSRSTAGSGGEGWR
jgi:hypothetical protein